MTKTALAEEIVQSIENHPDRNDQLECVIAFLTTLQPKDFERFAQWGYPEQKSTVEECWNDQ